MRVKFIKLGSSSTLGSFSPGDVANVSEAMAKHLVDDAGVAEYAEVSKAASASTTKPKREAKPKAPVASTQAPDSEGAGPVGSADKAQSDTEGSAGADQAAATD